MNENKWRYGGKEHKFWNIRYKRKHNVQMFFLQKSLMQIPKLNNERKIVSNKRNRQSIERIAFAPGSETWNKE